MCTASIVALTCICLVVIDCIRVCIDGKDRGGRYGR